MLSIPFARAAWAIISSRTGLFVMAGLALFTWHTLDKSSAVRGAVIEYVAQTELQTVRAQMAEQKRRAEVFEAANQKLEAEVGEAEQEREEAKQRIAEYEAQHPENGGGPIGDDLYKRLRNR